MLYDPITPLTADNGFDIRENLFYTWSFVFPRTIFEDILYNQTASLALGNQMPRAT